jgi:hypothetical protein
MDEDNDGHRLADPQPKPENYGWRALATLPARTGNKKNFD